MILFTDCPVCEKSIKNDVFVDQDIETKEIYFELEKAEQTCKHKISQKTLVKRALMKFEDMEKYPKYYNPELD